MAQREIYGMWVSTTVDPLAIEIEMVKRGGEFLNRSTKKMAGKGLLFHFLAGIALVWPEVKQHRWFTLFVENWLKNKYIGVIGPKNSGKSLCATICHLFDYYCFSSQTTILICSTTKERLEDRIWGEVKKFHRIATQRYRWLPGHLIEGRQRLITDDRDESTEGRDFRNGMLGVPCRRGNQFLTIGDFQGIKNKRIRLCGDELPALPKTFIDAIATLDAQADIKVTGMGNPAETTDCLGILCEPAMEIGGWEGGIDQTPKTKVWKTKMGGICIQFPGSDSPNMDEPEVAEKLRGQPLYPFLMSRAQMESDAKTWGKDDWHYTMFNDGRMPRGQGSRRVITKQLCQTHGAMNAPMWLDSNRTRITFLDAAYRAVGGDRCVFGELQFGYEARLDEDLGSQVATAIITQGSVPANRNQILALIDITVIPIKSSDFESPEDQIVMFVKQQHEQRRIPPENFFFDAGMRTSLVTAFSRLWSPRVNSIDFGGRASERRVSADIDVICRDYYSKFVTELWYSVRLIIEAGQFRGMTNDVMLEGCAREWKTVGGNKIEVETKAEMKEKTGRSPDLFDALVAGVEGARQKGFIIKRLGKPARTRRDDLWKDELRKQAEALRNAKALNYAA